MRDAQGVVISEQDVSLQISILKGSETGAPVYVETHQEKTSSFGLITLEIGNGTMISGNLPDIDWNADSYFIKIELDAAGGTNYQFMGTTKLLSVPYALNAGSVTSLKSLNIMEQTGHDADSALFEVKNQDGNTVFAVYNEGVRVTLSGDNKYLEDNPNSEILYGVEQSNTANDSKILGAYLSLQNPNSPPSVENPHMIMAVGNGTVWVVDNGEDLTQGDYLISSDVAGHAMRDNNEYDISYIIGRVAEPVKWSNIIQTINGIKHKQVSVFFESFIRDHKSEKLAKTFYEAIKEQQKQIEELKKEIEALKKGKQ